MVSDAASGDTAVEMFVGGLVLDPQTQSPVVLLKDEKGEFCLPIWIGVAEATSIASAIKQVPMQRPLTHDLMFTILNEISVRLERVLITALKESTYYAELTLSIGEKAIILDSRPSDAIALAVRASAPIFVAEEVLRTARVVMVRDANEPGVPSGEKAETGNETPKPVEGSDETQKQTPGQDFTSVDREKWDELLKELDPEDFKYKV